MKCVAFTFYYDHLFSGYLSESAPLGTYIAYVGISDDDDGANKEVELSIRTTSFNNNGRGSIQASLQFFSHYDVIQVKSGEISIIFCWRLTGLFRPNRVLTASMKINT